MSEELKPCPFCGGEAIMKEIDAPWIYIACHNCMKQISFMVQAQDDKETEKLAIKAWNTRVGEECNGDT